MAFVQRGGELGWGGWVDGVDCVLPTIYKGRGFLLVAGRRNGKREGEEGTYSGSFSATHSVSSASNLAMMTILSPVFSPVGL